MTKSRTELSYYTGAAMARYALDSEHARGTELTPEPTPEPPAAGYLSQNPISATEPSKAPASVFSIGTDSLAHEEAPEQLPLTSGRSEAKASVLDVQDDTVLCEVETAPRQCRVWLPLALFPHPPTYGMPILIGISETGGLRRPYVKTREIETQGADKWGDEFDNLIKEL